MFSQFGPHRLLLCCCEDLNSFKLGIQKCLLASVKMCNLQMGETGMLEAAVAEGVVFSYR